MTLAWFNNSCRPHLPSSKCECLQLWYTAGLATSCKRTISKQRAWNRGCLQ